MGRRLANNKPRTRGFRESLLTFHLLKRYTIWSTDKAAFYSVSLTIDYPYRVSLGAFHPSLDDKHLS
jgi:hypothetical protein